MKELEDIEENLNQVEYAYFNEIITNIDENISRTKLRFGIKLTN